MTADRSPLLLPRDHALLGAVSGDERLWRTFSPIRHVATADKGDVLTQDEGSVVTFQLKAGAIDLRKDGGSVWRPAVLDAALVETDSLYVGDYIGLSESTRDEVENCEVVKVGCVPEKPFRVQPDPYPSNQPEEPKFAAHALIVFSPAQPIGRGPAESRVAQCFRILTLGSVPAAIAEDS